jgi:hypothetical protein
MWFRYLAVTLSIVLILIAATAWATAQLVLVEPVTPTVMTGGDVGFRVEGLRGGTPVGTLVVKVNGQWVDAELKGTGRSTPLSRR